MSPTRRNRVALGKTLESAGLHLVYSRDLMVAMPWFNVTSHGTGGIEHDHGVVFARGGFCLFGTESRSSENGQHSQAHCSGLRDHMALLGMANLANMVFGPTFHVAAVRQVSPMQTCVVTLAAHIPC